MRFRTRRYGLVTDRELANEIEAERVAEEQRQRSDAEREAREDPPRWGVDEWLVYDLIHGRLEDNQ